MAVFPPPQHVALLDRQKPGTVLHPYSPHRVRGAKAKWGSPSCLPASGWSAEVGLWEAHQDGGPHSLHPKLTLGETPWVLADPMGRVGSWPHRSRSRPGPGVGRGGCGTHILHLEGLLLQRLHGQDVLDRDTVERQVPCSRARHEHQEGPVPPAGSHGPRVPWGCPPSRPGQPYGQGCPPLDPDPHAQLQRADGSPRHPGHHLGAPTSHVRKCSPQKQPGAPRGLR